MVGFGEERWLIALILIFRVAFTVIALVLVFGVALTIVAGAIVVSIMVVLVAIIGIMRVQRHVPCIALIPIRINVLPVVRHHSSRKHQLHFFYLVYWQSSRLLQLLNSIRIFQCIQRVLAARTIGRNVPDHHSAAVTSE